MAGVDEKLCEQRSGEFDRRFHAVDTRIDTLFRAVDEIKNSLAYRLPIWAVLLIGTLTTLVGWLARAAYG